VSFPTPLAVAVTVLSVVSGIGFLALLVRRGAGWRERVAAGLHVLMAIAMAGMPWAWGRTVAPPTAQIVVFGAATVYFILVLLVPKPATEAPSPGGHARHDDPLLTAYHAMMMAVMVPMAAMMIGTSTTGRDSGSMPPMPGMSGMGGPSSGTSATAGTDALASWTAIVLLGMGSVWILTRLVRSLRAGGTRGDQLTDVSLLVMSVGMLLAFLAM
jgi:hypothetical protein